MDIGFKRRIKQKLWKLLGKFICMRKRVIIQEDIMISSAYWTNKRKNRKMMKSQLKMEMMKIMKVGTPRGNVDNIKPHRSYWKEEMMNRQNLTLRIKSRI